MRLPAAVAQSLYDAHELIYQRRAPPPSAEMARLTADCVMYNRLLASGKRRTPVRLMIWVSVIGKT